MKKIANLETVPQILFGNFDQIYKPCKKAFQATNTPQTANTA